MSILERKQRAPLPDAVYQRVDDLETRAAIDHFLLHGADRLHASVPRGAIQRLAEQAVELAGSGRDVAAGMHVRQKRGLDYLQSGSVALKFCSVLRRRTCGAVRPVQRVSTGLHRRAHLSTRDVRACKRLACERRTPRDRCGFGTGKARRVAVT